MFADDVTLRTENPKDPTKKLLKLINEFSKLVYQNQYTKPLEVVYTNNKLSVRELRKQCHVHQQQQQQKF